MRSGNIKAVIIAPLVVLFLGLSLVWLKIPSNEQKSEYTLFEIGNDIYLYRMHHTNWPPSLRDVWKETSTFRLHKVSWEAYSTDAWGNPIEYTITDDKTAFLTIRRERRDVMWNMDYTHRMERRLSMEDPFNVSFRTITTTIHDSNF